MRVLVRDLMSSPVFAVAADSGFKAIVSMLEKARVSAVPVVGEDGRVLGIVSEADLLLKEERQELQERRLFEPPSRRTARRKAQGATAQDVMTAPAIVVAPEATVREAARTMHARAVKRLPVVDGEGRLLGIISRSDILKVFLRDDDEVRREITEDLILQTLWLDPKPVQVQVAAGVVTLAGELDRRSDVEILTRLANAVDGVVEVRAAGLSYRYDDLEARRSR